MVGKNLVRQRLGRCFARGGDSDVDCADKSGVINDMQKYFIEYVKYKFQG